MWFTHIVKYCFAKIQNRSRVETLLYRQIAVLPKFGGAKWHLVGRSECAESAGRRRRRRRRRCRRRCWRRRRNNGIPSGAALIAESEQSAQPGQRNRRTFLQESLRRRTAARHRRRYFDHIIYDGIIIVQTKLYIHAYFFMTDEITASFRRFGPLVVDWPHKAESKSYFPPKGYAFLLFQVYYIWCFQVILLFYCYRDA